MAPGDLARLSPYSAPTRRTSTDGGHVPLDPESPAHDVLGQLGTDQRYADREFMNLLEDTMSVADVNVADYDAIYLPGGHGVMFDFPQSEKLASLITGFYESGKIVSAVCHGPAGLLNVRLSSALTSRWVHHRVDGPVMRGVVLTFAIVSGAVLLLRG